MNKNIKKVILFIIMLICFSFVGCKSNQPESEVQEESVGQMEVSTDNNINSDDNVFDNTEDNIINDTAVTENNTEVNGSTTEDTDNTNNTVVEQNDNSDSSTKNEENTDGLPADSPSTINQIIFTETSETVYTTTDVNVRSSSSIETDNVIITLKKGITIERIGFNEEWSKVLYRNEICYIKSKYLTTEQPPADMANKDDDKDTSLSEDTSATGIQEDTTATDVQEDNTANEVSSEEDFVTDLNLASEIDQLICVIGNGGADCTVSFHVKDKNGIWNQQFSTDGDCGAKGITSNKKEGDGKTPAGLYSFTLAFGIKSDPGAKLPYRQITENDYWIDDLDSPYYNTWVNSIEIPGEYRSEHLIDHSPQYNYVMNIDYNPDCTPGLGSAIFLHGYNGLGKTTGCIALDEKYVKTLVKVVDSSTMILIVPDHDALSKY